MRVSTLLLVAAATLAGCKRAPDLNPPPASSGSELRHAEAPPPESPAAPGNAAPAAEAQQQDAWTAKVTEEKREGIPLTLREVRAAENDGFDRIVFQFEGTEIPGYRVEYIDRPAHHCGSGEPLEIAGDGLLEVSMQPAVAHDEAGELTIAAQELKPALPNLLELEQSCDFEGVVSFVAGVKSPNRYRVLELKDPARLVIDVRH